QKVGLFVLAAAQIDEHRLILQLLFRQNDSHLLPERAVRIIIQLHASPPPMMGSPLPDRSRNIAKKAVSVNQAFAVLRQGTCLFLRPLSRILFRRWRLKWTSDQWSTTSR